MQIIHRTFIVPIIVLIMAFSTGCDTDTVRDILPPIPLPSIENPDPVPAPENPPANDSSPENPPSNPAPMPDPIQTPPAPIETPIEPTGIISEVAVGANKGIFFSGRPPQAVGSITLLPFNNNSESIQFISGGSTLLPIVADEAFSVVYVLTDNEGYFKVDLPQAVVSADLIVTFSTIQANGELSNIAVQVANAVGEVSGTQIQPVSSVVVGTGELQVSVSWDKLADLDIHLIEPDGTRIFYNNTVSSSGGMLDLDSNANCRVIDGVNNENITYEGVETPSGTYTVEVGYYLSCNTEGATNYLVTVRNGPETNTYSGSFDGTEERLRRTVTTFERR